MPSASDLTSFTVSLPRALKEYLRERAAASGCSTPSEYIRRLLFEDQRARAQEELERKLLAGLDSPSRLMTHKDWSEVKEQVLERVGKRRKARSGRKDA
jgi:Arc/MetJ-type ribon-helix-helix transcriptional regulator